MDASSSPNSVAVLKSGSPIHYSSKPSHLPAVQPFKRTLPLSKPFKLIETPKLQRIRSQNFNNTLRMWLGQRGTGMQPMKRLTASASSNSLAKSATRQHRQVEHSFPSPPLYSITSFDPGLIQLLGINEVSRARITWVLVGEWVRPEP